MRRSIERNELEALRVGNFGAIRGVKAAVREYMPCICDCYSSFPDSSDQVTRFVSDLVTTCVRN